MPSRRPDRPIAVAADLGGTWIRVLGVTLEGHRLRSFKSAAPDLSRLPRFLPALWRRWRVAPSGVAALVVATKGVWTTAEKREQGRRLRGLARRVRVISDAEAAYLGALGRTPGLIVLAGTGSIVLGRTTRGRWIRRGGLGPLLGDEGSAFWIGREWLKATARGRNPARLLQVVRSPDAPSRIARGAVQVLSRARKGNRVARRILAQAQHHLAVQALEAVRALGVSPPIRVSWAGRLLDDPDFRAGFRRELKRSGLSLRLVPPREPPILAAVRLALRLGRRHRGTLR